MGNTKFSAKLWREWWEKAWQASQWSLGQSVFPGSLVGAPPLSFLSSSGLPLGSCIEQGILSAPATEQAHLVKPVASSLYVLQSMCPCPWQCLRSYWQHRDANNWVLNLDLARVDAQPMPAVFSGTLWLAFSSNTLLDWAALFYYGWQHAQADSANLAPSGVCLCQQTKYSWPWQNWLSLLDQPATTLAPIVLQALLQSAPGMLGISYRASGAVSRWTCSLHLHLPDIPPPDFSVLINPLPVAWMRAHTLPAMACLSGCREKKLHALTEMDASWWAPKELLVVEADSGTPVAMQGTVLLHDKQSACYYFQPDAAAWRLCLYFPDKLHPLDLQLLLSVWCVQPPVAEAVWGEYLLKNIYQVSAGINLDKTFLLLGWLSCYMQQRITLGVPGWLVLLRQLISSVELAGWPEGSAEDLLWQVDYVWRAGVLIKEYTARWQFTSIDSVQTINFLRCSQLLLAWMRTLLCPGEQLVLLGEQAGKLSFCWRCTQGEQNDN